MHQYSSRPARWAIALLAMTSLGGLSSAAVAQPSSPEQQYAPPALPNQEQPEVLSRGPVHEAFAEPVNIQLQAGLVAPDRPPPNIEELPPEERPQGQQFVWIPGYWSWDADRHGYIWVSACWRVAPPRMSWVPGYWSPVSGGWEWVAGFWTPAGAQEIEYLPAPPTDDDVEPLGPPPSEDTIWVPPCMYWVQGQYVRRGGYWLAAQPNWVWVPSHYLVTPRGYIFAAGHWDYSLERRGVLFAPIYFPAGYYGRSGYTFSPSIVIDVGLLRVSLFAYPRYSHYYFGDYYDDAYLRVGIYPWFDSRQRHSWYDPIYEHDRWQNHRSEPRWEQRGRDDYNRRRGDKDLRPARTFREQESRTAKLPESQRRAFQVAQQITAVASRRETPIKFERINTDARQKISKQANAVHTFRDERSRWESEADTKTVKPSKEHKATVTQPAERRETDQPSRERRPAVTQPAERRETVQPQAERKPSAPTQAERRETVQPPAERRETVQPQAERKPSAPTQAERRETVQPPAERRETVQPQAERKPAAPPQAERREAAKPRDPAFVPPRETRVSQPERVRIPAPPVVGRSGAPGLFQKGPPSRPTDEDRENKGKDSRKK